MKTILLADDSITIQKVVELTFSDGDYRVFCVANGAQALRKIPEIRPDVILLDVVMPEKNGYEVCEALRADPATAAIPVLLLTGTFEPFDRARAEAAGAHGHVTKPFESHTLVQRVEELLTQSAGHGPVTRAPAAAPVAVPPGAATSGFGATQQAASRPAQAVAPAMPPVEEMPAAPHPAFAAPEPDTGGAYLGFADLAIGEEETVVRDRFDEMDTPPGAADTAAPASEAETGEFVSGYDLPQAVAAPARTPSSSKPGPAAIPDDPPAEAAAAGGALSADTLDRLADLVVRRMSERVVREIAWEVIPGVAETVVRQRIKELEEQEG